MKLDAWRHLERGLRGLTPLALTLALVLLAVLPLPLREFTAVTPGLTLMSVYYWSIYRPDRLPLAATFAVGVVQDALAGTPLGLSALVRIRVQEVVVSQRRFFHGKNFLVEWWGFILVAPAAVAAGWALTSIYFGVVVPPRPLGFQLLLTISLYPCLAWLFARAQDHVLRPA